MKKLFHFNFSIFRSGGALRHSPLCSLIIALILVLSLTLYPVSPVRANALQQIQPVYDTTITQLYEMVSQRMTPVQEDVFNLMLGTYAAGYGGFAQYQLSDPYASQDGVIAWLKSCGIELYNTILSFGGIGEDPITGVDLRPVIKSLVEVAYGVGVKAQSYTGVDPESDFLSDVSDSVSYYLPYNLDINSSLNQIFGYVGGMYDWQFTVLPFSDFSNFTWSTRDLTGSNLDVFNSYFSDMSRPLYCNSGSNYYVNCICERPDVVDRFNCLFFDTFSNIWYICDSHGIKLSPVTDGMSISNYQYYPSSVLQYYLYSDSFQLYTDNSRFIYFNSHVSFNGDLSIATVINNLLSNNRNFFYLPNNSSYIYYDFVSNLQHVYYGASWDDRQEYFVSNDLNIADTPIEYVSNPPVDSDTLLDIKGLIQDLIDTNDLRAPVINNFYYPDEAAVPEADLDRTTYDPTDYAGVVSVPDGIWDGLATDDHDGFIDYLWYMTKPLVQFTAGFIESVTFGPEGDFDETGPGIIVFGVISLGLAGGLVSKFLL